MPATVAPPPHDGFSDTGKGKRANCSKPAKSRTPSTRAPRLDLVQKFSNHRPTQPHGRTPPKVRHRFPQAENRAARLTPHAHNAQLHAPVPSIPIRESPDQVQKAKPAQQYFPQRLPPPAMYPQGARPSLRPPQKANHDHPAQAQWGKPDGLFAATLATATR